MKPKTSNCNCAQYNLHQLITMLTNSASRIVFQQEEKTYSAAECLADILSLQRQILPPKQRWALCYEDTYTFTIALLAVLSSGAEPILLPNNQPGTLASFAAEYDAVLTDINYHLHLNGKPILFFDSCQLENTISSDESISESAAHNPQQTITIFTSGSTGKPKKASRTLGQLSCEIGVLERLFGATMDAAAVFATVSHQHIYGLLFHILWPLCSGRVIYLPIVNFPKQIIEIIKNSSSSLVLISSPAMLKRMHNLQVRAQPITIFSSGGLLEKNDAARVNASLGVYPIEVLGSTETSGIAFRQRHPSKINASRWQPLPLVKLRLEPTSQCLVVRSPFFDGDEDFMLGDMASFSEDGSFELLGRADRLVKIEEKRVSLIQIENLLEADELVEQAYALKLETNRQYIAAIIVLSVYGQNLLEKNGKLWLNNHLKTVLSEHLDRLLLPKQFRYVNEIPTNSQGKYVIEELKQLFKT